MDVLNEQEKTYFESGGETVPAEAQDTQEAPAETAAPVSAEPAPAAEAEATEHEQRQSDPPEVIAEKLKRAIGETRHENRELKAQLRLLQQQQAEFNRRVEETTRKLQGEQPAVTMETDPAGYLKEKVERTEAELAAIKKADAEKQALGQFTNWYATQAAQFKAQAPDFQEAYDHFQRSRGEQLLEAGLTAEQATERFRYEEAQLAIAAAQSGMNPAQLVYQTAIARGYKPAAAAKPAKASNLESVKKGVESSRPMAAVGGGGQTENLTWESLASMPAGPEFKKMWAKLEAKEGLR